MTWQSAKAVAAEYLRRMELPDDLSGICVRLADYECQSDMDFLKPERGWSLEYHRMVNGAFARLLRRRKATVTTITIKLVEYYDWIAANQLENNAMNRARFISEKTK